MADVGIYCKFDNITKRVGANASAVSNLVAWTDVIVLDVESKINALTRKNWSDDYAGLNVDVKYILMETAACMCAMYVLNYDTSAMSARESETRLDFLKNTFDENIKYLIDVKTKTFVDGA